MIVLTTAMGPTVCMGDEYHSEQAISGKSAILSLAYARLGNL